MSSHIAQVAPGIPPAGGIAQSLVAHSVWHAPVPQKQPELRA